MKLFPVDPPDEETELFEGDIPLDSVSEAQARSSLHGREFDGEAFDLLRKVGAQIVEEYPRLFGHYRLDALVEGTNGSRFYVVAHGTPDRTDRHQAGLKRTDTVLKLGFKALMLRERRCEHPLLVLTSHMPKSGSRSAFLLAELRDAVFDVIRTSGSLDDRQRMDRYLNDPDGYDSPLEAEWRQTQLTLDDFDPFDDTEDEKDA
jgi:hypothetical protein